MAKMTKAQQKRLANSILSKSKKLWDQVGPSGDMRGAPPITTKDLIAIEAIVKRTLKRIG